MTIHRCKTLDEWLSFAEPRAEGERLSQRKTMGRISILFTHDGTMTSFSFSVGLCSFAPSSSLSSSVSLAVPSVVAIVGQTTGSSIPPVTSRQSNVYQAFFTAHIVSSSPSSRYMSAASSVTPGISEIPAFVAASSACSSAASAFFKALMTDWPRHMYMGANSAARSTLRR